MAVQPPTPKAVVTTLKRKGFHFVRQRGSHARFEKGPLRVTVPLGSKPLRHKTFRAIVKQSGIPAAAFYRSGTRRSSS